MSVGFFVNWSGLVGLGFRVIGGGWGGASVFFAFVFCIVGWYFGLSFTKVFVLCGFLIVGSACFCLGFALCNLLPFTSFGRLLFYCRSNFGEGKYV